MKYLLLLSTYNNENLFLKQYELIKGSGLDIDILIVDRGSSDRTKHFLRNNNVPRLVMGIHGKYYEAISLGLSYAYENKYDGVVEFDIEGRFAIGDIPYLIATYENKKNDLILASRYLDKTIKVKKRNKLIKFSSQLVLRKKISDPTTRFKLYGKRAIAFFGKKMTINSPEPDRIIHFLRAGFTFKEIQIEMDQKFKKQNPHKVSKAISETITWVLSILFSNPYKKEGK